MTRIIKKDTVDIPKLNHEPAIWDIKLAYTKGTFVWKDGLLCKANNDIPKDTAFVLDNDYLEGATWQSGDRSTSDVLTAWAPGKLYKVGVMVKYNNKIHSCLTEHTSDTLFSTDSAKWKDTSEVAGQRIINPADFVAPSELSITKIAGGYTIEWKRLSMDSTYDIYWDIVSIDLKTSDPKVFNHTTNKYVIDTLNPNDPIFVYIKRNITVKEVSVAPLPKDDTKLGFVLANVMLRPDNIMEGRDEMSDGATPYTSIGYEMYFEDGIPDADLNKYVFVQYKQMPMTAPGTNQSQIPEPINGDGIENYLSGQGVGCVRTTILNYNCYFTDTQTASFSSVIRNDQISSQAFDRFGGRTNSPGGGGGLELRPIGNNNTWFSQRWFPIGSNCIQPNRLDFYATPDDVKSTVTSLERRHCYINEMSSDGTANQFILINYPPSGAMLGQRAPNTVGSGATAASANMVLKPVLQDTIMFHKLKGTSTDINVTQVTSFMRQSVVLLRCNTASIISKKPSELLVETVTSTALAGYNGTDSITDGFGKLTSEQSIKDKNGVVTSVKSYLPVWKITADGVYVIVPTLLSKMNRGTADQFTTGGITFKLHDTVNIIANQSASNGYVSLQMHERTNSQEIPNEEQVGKVHIIQNGVTHENPYGLYVSNRKNGYNGEYVFPKNTAQLNDPTLTDDWWVDYDIPKRYQPGRSAQPMTGLTKFRPKYNYKLLKFFVHGGFNQSAQLIYQNNLLSDRNATRMAVNLSQIKYHTYGDIGVVAAGQEIDDHDNWMWDDDWNLIIGPGTNVQYSGKIPLASSGNPIILLKDMPVNDNETNTDRVQFFSGSAKLSVTDVGDENVFRTTARPNDIFQNWYWYQNYAVFHGINRGDDRAIKVFIDYETDYICWFNSQIDDPTVRLHKFKMHDLGINVPVVPASKIHGGKWQSNRPTQVTVDDTGALRISLNVSLFEGIGIKTGVWAYALTFDFDNNQIMQVYEINGALNNETAGSVARRSFEEKSCGITYYMINGCPTSMYLSTNGFIYNYWNTSTNGMYQSFNYDLGYNKNPSYAYNNPLVNFSEYRNTSQVSGWTASNLNSAYTSERDIQEGVEPKIWVSKSNKVGWIGLGHDSHQPLLTHTPGQDRGFTTMEFTQDVKPSVTYSEFTGSKGGRR